MYSASKNNFIFYLLKTFFVKLENLVCFSVGSIADEHEGHNRGPHKHTSTKLGTSGKKWDIKLHARSRGCVNIISQIHSLQKV